MTEDPRPAIKHNLYGEALDYLGFAKNKLKQLDEDRRKKGIPFKKKVIPVGPGGRIRLSLICADNKRQIRWEKPAEHVYQMRAFSVPWDQYWMDNVRMGGVSRFKADPGVTFDSLGDDWLTYENFFPVATIVSIERACYADWHNRFFEMQDGTINADGGGSLNALILHRNVNTGETVPAGPYDSINVTYGTETYNYKMSVLEFPTSGTSYVGSPVSGYTYLTIRAFPSLTRTKLTGDPPAPTVYTAVEGQAGGMAANDAGIHVYYREKDSDGDWHPYLLTFDTALNFVSQVSLPVDFKCSKVRGKLVSTDAGTFEVKTDGENVFICGLDQADAPYLVKVDKDGTASSTALTLPTNHFLADFTMDDKAIFFLTHYRTADTNKVLVDDLTGQGYPGIADRYTYQYEHKISYIPIDMSTGILTAIQTGTRYFGNEDTRYGFLTLLMAKGLLYFAYPEGFFHNTFGFEVPPWTVQQIQDFPYETANASYQYNVKIERLSVTHLPGQTPAASLNLIDTDVTTSDWDTSDWPGGTIGKRHWGLMAGPGVNEKRIG